LQQEPDYLANTEVVLMPMSNPDGFQYSTTNDRYHRKNMRSGSSCIGVDLNRNYDAAWGGGGSSGSECSQTYRGPSVESEPETRVIKQVMQEAPMTVYVDVHAYSELILSSYGYTTATHPRATEYRALGGSIQSAIRQVDGRTWTEGPTAQVLYTADGTTNDYADKLGALGLCFELRPDSSGGGGFAPPASDILPGAQESFAGMIAAIDFAKSYVPPAPTPAPPPGTWTLTGSGCVMEGNCVHSKNYPQNYGNGEQCNINLYGDIPISFEAFSTESRYDILTMGGTPYSGTSVPPSGTYSGSISWASDYSVVSSGWKLCRQGSSPSPLPTPAPTTPSPTPAPTTPAPTTPSPTPAPTTPSPTPAPTTPAPTPPSPPAPTPSSGNCSSWCEPPADCTDYPYSCSGCCSGSPSPPSPPAPSPPPSGDCYSICDLCSDITNYPSICGGCTHLC